MNPSGSTTRRGTTFSLSAEQLAAQQAEAEARAEERKAKTATRRNIVISGRGGGGSGTLDAPIPVLSSSQPSTPRPPSRPPSEPSPIFSLPQRPRPQSSEFTSPPQGTPRQPSPIFTSPPLATPSSTPPGDQRISLATPPRPGRLPPISSSTQTQPIQVPPSSPILSTTPTQPISVAPSSPTFSSFSSPSLPPDQARALEETWVSEYRNVERLTQQNAALRLQIDQHQETLERIRDDRKRDAEAWQADKAMYENRLKENEEHIREYKQQNTDNIRERSEQNVKIQELTREKDGALQKLEEKAKREEELRSEYHEEYTKRLQDAIETIDIESQERVKQISRLTNDANAKGIELKKVYEELAETTEARNKQQRTIQQLQEDLKTVREQHAREKELAEAKVIIEKKNLEYKIESERKRADEEKERADQQIQNAQRDLGEANEKINRLAAESNEIDQRHRNEVTKLNDTIIKLQKELTESDPNAAEAVQSANERAVNWERFAHQHEESIAEMKNVQEEDQKVKNSLANDAIDAKRSLNIERTKNSALKRELQETRAQLQRFQQQFNERKVGISTSFQQPSSSVVGNIQAAITSIAISSGDKLSISHKWRLVDIIAQIRRVCTNPYWSYATGAYMVAVLKRHRMWKPIIDTQFNCGVDLIDAIFLVAATTNNQKPLHYIAMIVDAYKLYLRRTDGPVNYVGRSHEHVTLAETLEFFEYLAGAPKAVSDRYERLIRSQEPQPELIGTIIPSSSSSSVTDVSSFSSEDLEAAAEYVMHDLYDPLSTGVVQRYYAAFHRIL